MSTAFTNPTYTHSFAQELEKAASEAFDKPFLRMATGEWTYGEIAGAAASLATGLRALGVRHRSNVSVLLPNCMEFVVTWFAISRIGAVMAPVNSSLRGQPLLDALALVESEVVVVHESLWPHFQDIRAELKSVREVVVVGNSIPGTHAWSDLCATPFDGLPPQAVHFSELCLLLYTSGSTGKSKAVRIPHRYVLRQAQGVIDGLGLRTHDVLYCPYQLLGYCGLQASASAHHSGLLPVALTPT